MESNEIGSKELVARKSRLIDLVGYQEGSVVSRTVIEKEMGTVTLFAFDQGQGLSEHTTPYDAMIHLLEGEADILISGKTHRLKEGEAIIMPASRPHSVKAIKKFKMMLIMVRS
jgi:quercetin dioxygenase-like cupin family protein